MPLAAIRFERRLAEKGYVYRGLPDCIRQSCG